MIIKKFSNAIIYFSLVFFLLTITSCNKLGINIGKKTKQYSSTTGWEYNSPEWGGFTYDDNFKPTIGPGLILIPGGVFVMGSTQPDIMYEWNNTPRTVTVATFYMDETEVRNVDYREYLHWLSRVYGNEYPQVVKKALPDSLVWREELAYNEPYTRNYFSHPAYAEYPVVGITWEQAKAYAEWRTDRVNEMLLIKNRVIKSNLDQKGANNFNVDAYLAGEYDAELDQGIPDNTKEGEEIRHASWTDGVMIPSYRLPTEAEWEYAAYGVKANEDEVIENKRIYPWAGKWLRNDGERNHGNKPKDRGKMMANFVRGKGDYKGVAGAWNDKGDLTLPVKSFWPNDFGLYCMAGNVNEWVADVYRPLTFEDVEEFNPYRGNIFLERAKDKDGNLLPKDSLGRISKTIQNDNDLVKRNNYRKGDNRNYRDGDLKSSISQDGTWVSSGSRREGNMYSKDKGDFNRAMISMISDKSRVYKGGSWRDRAFWLAPAQRRFLNQDEASNDIGFRCAMSHIGPTEDIKINKVTDSKIKKRGIEKKKRKGRRSRIEK